MILFAYSEILLELRKIAAVKLQIDLWRQEN